MGTKQHTVGMVGLGVMGSNLVLNMQDHGISVAGYDVKTEQVQHLNRIANRDLVDGFETLPDFIHALASPRMVMLMVPAGPIVDTVIHELLPLLSAGDIIIDGGNSHFTDTELRQQALAEQNIHLLGVGISGGEDGARHGPSIMPGGLRDAYEQIRPVFEQIAAHVDGEPCVTYLGPRGAGHYVKMVHNGIEYAIMQLIAETYDLMKRGFGLSDDELQATYTQWNTTELNSYLLEITARIFAMPDPETGRRLIDEILDVARQKGTGMWTAQDALSLRVPTPLIDTAVGMRDLSMLEEVRAAASELLVGPSGRTHSEQHAGVPQLQRAFYFGIITAFAQGFAQLRVASHTYQYNLPLADIAAIWRGGCIIRDAVLPRIRTVYQQQPSLAHLLLDHDMAQELAVRQADLRNVVWTALDLGLPTPGFMSVLGYYDALRSAWLPANLIQAQRDYFGAHTYERIDEKGTFHTEWA